jgi:hypothetical protein
MGWWSELFVQKSEDWIFSPLDSSQVPDEPKSRTALTTDEVYLTITVKSMRVVKVRVLTSKFYGVVNAFTSINHSSGSVATFQTVTTPSELQKVDAKNIDKVIQSNIPLVGPVPYRGEKVSLELGLFSVKEEDLAAPFIKLLETMSRTAGVSVLSNTIPYVQPIKEGIEALIGTSDSTSLNIGVSTSWNPPVTGWYLVMACPKDDANVNEFMVTANDYRLVDKNTNRSVKDYSYLVFTITASQQRQDWFLLPYLKETYSQLQAAVKNGKRTEAEELLVIFKRYALTSDDLLFNDAERIVKLVEDKAKMIMSATMVSLGDEEMPPLESYPLYH